MNTTPIQPPRMVDLLCFCLLIGKFGAHVPVLAFLVVWDHNCISQETFSLGIESLALFGSLYLLISFAKPFSCELIQRTLNTWSDAFCDVICLFSLAYTLNVSKLLESIVGI